MIGDTPNNERVSFSQRHWLVWDSLLHVQVSLIQGLLLQPILTIVI